MVRRLTEMSRAELRHRARRALRQRLGWLPGAAREAGRDDGWVARTLGEEAACAELPAYLARVLSARLYGRDWRPAMLAEGLRAAGAAERIVAEADDVANHRLRVLGYGVHDFGPAIDWHHDPVARARWPRRYWGLMTRGRREGWDPKVIWEPSRHQHLPGLAAASALTGETRYADEVADQLKSWIAQNPTGVGIHWVESIEPALRVLSWLWTLPIVLTSSERFTPACCGTILRSLVVQTRHVADNLSTYTSPNTHLIAEALALFIVGTVLPELESASAWREQGRAILEREITVQVGEDGVYREASLYYHAYTVEFYLIASVIASRNGVSLAPVVRERLERMLEALAWLVRPDGTLPNVGDADGGRTLRLGAPNLSRVGELLASGAVLCGRAELRGGVAASGEEAAWLWPDGVARLKRLGWTGPVRGWRAFPDAHLAVERRRVGGDDRWLLFDAGDLGMLSGGHGHAGCLGIELFAHARALLVDRGTGVYNAAPEWRRYFRGTRAHSTVVVDGEDQAQHAGEFRWGTRYRSRLVRELSGSEYVAVTGEHDGYRRLAQPVRHRRTLISVSARYWACVDVLDGSGMHDVEFLFHLAPDLEASASGDRVFACAPDAADGLLIVAAGFGGAMPTVVRGSGDPIQGWHSDDYGERRAAPVMIVRERMELPAVRVHLLAPAPRQAEAPAVITRRLEQGLAVSIDHGDGRDLLLCAPGGPRHFALDAADFVGELLHARVARDGALQAALGLQARRLDWNGVPVADARGIADWMIAGKTPSVGRAAVAPERVLGSSGARAVVNRNGSSHARSARTPIERT
jgi:uncharacterized heparinase superfamily protein